MSVELNPLAISLHASFLFLAGHLMGAESFVYFTFLQWHLPTEWVMKNVNFKCLFSLPSYLLLLSIFLSLTVSVFSPVVFIFVSKPEIVKNVFSF